MKYFKVAIDGPAGSGKSTISSIVASKLGYTHIDTGAMFRAVTLYAYESGIDLEDESQYTFLDDLKIIYKNGKTFLNGKDVSKEIREENITNNVSTVAKIGIVREKMLEFQRESARTDNVVMDGRDIGTVVLPDADLKVFLTASAQERAKRRLKEYEEKGIQSDFETILREIKIRDAKDSERAIAPLKKATDAVLLDTTSYTIDEVVNQIINLIQERKNKMEKELSFEEMLNQYEVKPGDIVDGVVVSIPNDNECLIDIKSVTEGKMYLNKYTKDKNITSFKQVLKVGDTIKCEVVRISRENKKYDNTEIFLSRLNLLKVESFDEIKKNFEAEKELEVTIVKEIKGGYLCNYNGIELFLPKSQSISTDKVNTNTVARIIEIDEKQRRATISTKAIEHEKFVEKRNSELEKINEGDELEGVITKVEKYAAFVKISNVTGIIKARDVCHEFVENIQTVLHAGDTVKVKVLSKDGNKLALSRKALLKTAYQEYKESHKVGDIVTGKVTNKLAYGLLVELTPNLKGLLHKSEFSYNAQNDSFMKEVVVGQEIEAKIIEMNDEDEKVGLSKKALTENPWEKLNIKAGDKVQVTVKEVRGIGLVVDLGGLNVFIHQSETIKDDKKALADFYQVDQKVEALVKAFDKDNQLIKLSIKALKEADERASYEKYLNEEESNSSIGDQFKDVLEK